MLELPEAAVIAQQLNALLAGKRISDAVAGYSPHGFAWYYGDPAAYGDRLRSKTVGHAYPLAGRINIQVEDMMLHFGDGVNLRYYAPEDKKPDKHQLRVDFQDGSALVGTVAMYGGLWCFEEGALDQDFYYRASADKPSPLSDAFDAAYFDALFADDDGKMSAKAFLATQQRIPGLGNGVLQDILFNAGLHPKKKIRTLTDAQKEALYHVVKATLQNMTAQGGRDTEKDLLGQEGGYTTLLSKKTVGKPCPRCGEVLVKEAYMGGSVYYCPGCQEK